MAAVCSDVALVSQVMDLKGHTSQVMAAAFNPDGTKAVTASKDGTLRLWNINVRYHLRVSLAPASAPMACWQAAYGWLRCRGVAMSLLGVFRLSSVIRIG
jgi:WD40 repeat protein